jgi:hypothetical protein
MKSQGQPDVRMRCWILVLVLVYVNCYWTVFQEAIWYAWPTDAVPFSTVIVIVFLLTVMNFLIKRFAPRQAFTYSELIVIYIMLSISSAIANWNMFAAAIPSVGHAFWFASPENEWQDLIWQHLPSWLTISDSSILRPYYQGETTIFTLAYMKAWATPVLLWTACASVLFSSMALISSVLRKQWTQRERLTYPVIQMPLQMMNPDGRFFKNKLMWLGFAISSVIVIINSIHFFHPSIPYIPVKRRNIDYLFTDKPWNAAMPMKISFYPFIIGLGFLMPLDLCFSAWFFYLFGRMQLVLISASGLQIRSRFPYLTEQSFGAVIAISCFYIWTGRKHLKRVLKCFFSRNSDYDANEPIRYRATLWAFGGCIVFLLLFLVRMGMSLWVAVCYLGILYALSVVITRVRAELGMPVHDFEGLEPRTSLLTITGTLRLGAKNLTAITLMRWAETGDYNPHPMPHYLEGFKMAERAGTNYRKMFYAILIAVVASSFFCLLTSLQMYYRYGASSGNIPTTMTRWYGESSYSRLQQQLTYPVNSDLIATGAMGFGAVFGSILMYMRMRFIWWQFHALGYILASSWAMYNLWTCVLISWLAKLIILKHGGLRSYRTALPFFWGLILGDFIAGGLWLAIGLIFDMDVYVFYL